MKPVVCACAVLLLAIGGLCASVVAQAQRVAQPVVSADGTAEPYAPRTGDAWVDAHLRDIAVYAERYPDAFADELERYLGVRRNYVLALRLQPGWNGGEVYYACALAQALGQPCRAVVRARTLAGADGWKAVLARVQPGAATPPRAVRESIRRSYAHWARPLD